MAAQLLLNGLVTGLLLALPALALTLIFGIMRFANFAVGALITLGAYAGFAANVLLGLPLPLAAVFAALVVGLACVICDELVFEKLRERGSITLLVASMGVSLIIENICRFSFGNAARSFDIAVARPIRWHGIRINHEQMISAGVVVVALIILHLLLTASPLGRAMRAVADNPALAAVRGVERRVVARITWMLTGALIGISGVLAGLDRAIDPLMGWNYQIPIFAAAILGGLGSPMGAVAGALLIGVAEEMSTLVLPPAYRQIVSFSVILLLLLFRTNGLFGARVVRK